MPDEILDGHCSSQQLPLSIVDLAGPNATLAGVLAGFVLLVITTILSAQALSDGVRSDALRQHVFALLGTSVTILAFSAFLFGCVAATKPPAIEQLPQVPVSKIGYSVIVLAPANPNEQTVDSDPMLRQVCEKAWTQAMPALGMLGVGATLTIAGICCVVARYRNGKGTEEAEGDKNLAILGNTATGLVIIGTTALLTSETVTYLNEMATEFKYNLPTGVKYAVIGYGLVSTGLTALVLLTRNWIFWRLAQGKWFYRRSHEAGELFSPREWPVKLICTCVLLCYLLFGSLFFVWLAPMVLFRPHGNPWWTLGLVIVFSLVLPGLVFFLIAVTMPGPRIARFGCWTRKKQDVDTNSIEPTSSTAPVQAALFAAIGVYGLWRLLRGKAD
jgi:hypothetical protein